MMFDPEGRPPGGVSHWVAYGIPVSVTGFAEGEVSKPSDKYVGGQSLMKLPSYFGPCTPPGAPHHYTFTLIATDLEPTALKEGMTRDEVIKALDGHAEGATGLIGTFRIRKQVIANGRKLARAIFAWRILRNARLRRAPQDEDS